MRNSYQNNRANTSASFEDWRELREDFLEFDRGDAEMRAELGLSSPCWRLAGHKGVVDQ